MSTGRWRRLKRGKRWIFAHRVPQDSPPTTITSIPTQNRPADTASAPHIHPRASSGHYRCTNRIPAPKQKGNSRNPTPRPTEIAPHRHHLNTHAKSSCRDSHRLTFAPRPFLRYSQVYQPAAQHQLSHSQNHALRKEGELNYFPPIVEKNVSKGS